MISEYEARMIRRDMKDELEAAPSAVWKCALGLAIVVALALTAPAASDAVALADSGQISSSLNR